MQGRIGVKIRDDEEIVGNMHSHCRVLWKYK